jgi:hypothetical protein
MRACLISRTGQVTGWMRLFRVLRVAGLHRRFLPGSSGRGVPLVMVVPVLVGHEPALLCVIFRSWRMGMGG